VGRYPRYHPPTESETTLVEITSRVIQGRALLRPSTKLNRRIIGVIGRAQKLYDVQIHAVGFLSTHDHQLCSFVDTKQQALFMQHVQTNLSKEVGRLHDWSGAMWGRRYRGIPVSEEEEAQYSRYRYVLEQGTKEDLVASPLEWPGVNCAWALWHGLKEMEGEWVDRTGLYNARRKEGGAQVREEDFTFPSNIVLTPPPFLAHLSWDEYQAYVRTMVDEIEQEARERHRRTGCRPLGAAKVLARHPHSWPEHLDRSPAPQYHCSAKEKLAGFWEGFRDFVATYRDAAERLRKGELTAVFPPGCFAPRRQFVPRRREPEPRARGPDPPVPVLS
jgi:hypothetical protein